MVLLLTVYVILIYVCGRGTSDIKMKINGKMLAIVLVILVISGGYVLVSSTGKVPGKPTNLQVVEGDGKVNLSWTPSAEDASEITGYKIYRGLSQDNLNIVIDIGAKTSYADEGLLNNVTYYYRVAAVNADGESEKSAEVSATPLVMPVPAYAEELKIGHVSTAGNTFGWTDMGTYLYRATVYQESLVGVDSEGNYVPRLADSWETTDSKMWTFHLHHNVTWHDGVPFTARDVVFTINYTLEKKPWGMNDAKFMEQISKVTMPDDYTVVIEMNEPYSNLLNNIRVGLVVVPEHIYKSVDDPMAYGLPPTELNATVGTGPYKVVSLDTTARVLKFTVNENYYRGTPSVKNITIHYYSGADSMILALMKGEIDTTFGWGAGIDYYYVAKILSTDDLDIILNPSAAINALNMNNNKAPFDNAAMREAIANSLDYVQLRDIIQGGYGSIANTGIVPPSMAYYVDTPAFTQNVTKAKTLLDSLGFVDVDSDGYRESPNGTKFQPVLLLRSSTTWATRSAEIVESNLKSIGIDVQLDVVSSSSIWQSERRSRQYDLILSGTSQAGTFAWEGYYTAQVDGNGSLADCQVFDAGFQSLIVQLRTATTAAEKKAAAEALQQYYSENIPAVPLYWSYIIQPYNTKYTGFGFDPEFGTIMCYDTYFNLDTN